MVIEILGIKDTRFMNKETGEVVEGQSVYFSYDDEKVIGVATDRCFLTRSKKLDPVPALPAMADLYYNKYGKVDEIIVKK